MKKLRWPVVLFAAVTVLTSACAEAESGPPPEVLDPQKRSHSSGAIVVEEVAEGLNVGWDIGFLPDGKLLIPERPGTLSVVSSTKPGAKVSKVKADLPKPYVEAEGGLLGMVLHPDFEQSRRFTLCQTTEAGGKPKDIRLTTWRLSKDNKRAVHVKDLITGLPIHKTGQHVGCRPTIGPDGELLIGTGDAWQPTTSQDKTNLGGKVLRVDLETGKGLPDNPFADSKDENTRRILTFGHRNVQGVAVRPGNNEVWTVEHGPGHDDEINLIKPGGNYGWDPSLKGELTDPESYTGQDPKTEMTNLELYPDAVEAKWATGKPTEAMCAGVFLEGEHWGDLEGNLAVTSLKGSKLLLMSVDGNSRVVKVDVPKELDETYHRLRAARIGPDGALYLTTAGGENDYLLRVTPGK